jgi:hypothetical protein
MKFLSFFSIRISNTVPLNLQIKTHCAIDHSLIVETLSWCVLSRLVYVETSPPMPPVHWATLDWDWNTERDLWYDGMIIRTLCLDDYATLKFEDTRKTNLSAWYDGMMVWC